MLTLNSAGTPEARQAFYESATKVSMVGYKQ